MIEVTMNAISTCFMLLRNDVTLCRKGVLQNDRDALYTELMLPSSGCEMC